MESALLAHRWAAEHCERRGGGGCAWYHGSWQFLRLLNLVSTPTLAAPHYAAEFARGEREPGFQRVLITGSADYGMLEVLQAARARGAAPRSYTVLDRCATPLRLCEWYGKRHALTVATLHQDVLAGLPADRFDSVYTHAFMGNFTRDSRVALVRQWARALRPGGRVVTVQRVREGVAGGEFRFTAGEAAAFEARVAALVRGLPPAVAGLDLVAMAREYAHRLHGHAVASAQELRDLFESAGFRLDRFERSVARDTPGMTGPSVPNADGFYLITAERQ